MEATSGVLDEIVSLPEGGGEVNGLGERFQPDLLKGTGNYSVPIEVPGVPDGPKPDLSLDYSTGAGNDVFGMGWSIAGSMAITRRTDDGVPAYDGADEFALGSAVLVPVGDGRYRPRRDEDGRHISRGNGGGWIVRTPVGERYELGTTATSRVTDDEGDRVLSWLLAEREDAAGNAVSYEYDHHRNAAYLSRITWGTYVVEFEYESRPDVLRNGRGGFEVTTARRCSAIELRSDALDSPRIARWTFTYEQADGSGVSLLTAIEKTGYGPDGETETIPPVQLSYTGHDADDTSFDRVGSPDGLPPLDDPSTTLVDMTGDGLPDVLETGGDGHHFWPNQGDGTFGTRRSVPISPFGMELGRAGVSLGDLNGDGAVDLFRMERGIGTTVRNTGDGSWADRPTVYSQTMALDLSATDSRVLDLDGDGTVDLLQSGPGGYLLAYNRAGDGWSPAQAVSKYDEVGPLPEVDLGSDRIHVADFTGDGLSDIAIVESGHVAYWPHYGRGVWGERVEMETPPTMPGGFDRDRLYLADLDRDGATDLLYVDEDTVYYWLNRTGTGWSGHFEVPFVPPPNEDALHLTDLNGNGMRGLVWSEPDRDTAGGGSYRHLDLGAATKPHLLARIDDGTGLRTRIEYTTTTAERRRDREAGEDWESYLPFPVQVVDAYVETDTVTERTRRSELRYHDGTFDVASGEFRGFERVELEVEGDDHVPTVLQETTFHQGGTAAPGGSSGFSPQERAAAGALHGRPRETVTYEIADDGPRTRTKSATMTYEARLAYTDGDNFVHVPELRRTETRLHDPDAPDRIDAADYEYDAYGNVTRRVRRSRFADEDPSEAIVLDRTMTYVTNESEWLVGLRASEEVRDRDGRLRSHTLRFYDGDPFVGLPNGEATTGLLTRERELVFADWALPAGYADEIESDWGLTHDGEGYYRDSNAVEFDHAGRTVGLRTSLGTEHRIEYDDDGYPKRMRQAVGTDDEASVSASYDRRTGQPASIEYAHGAEATFEYSPIGRLRAKHETASDGTLELTGAFSVDWGDPTSDPPTPPSATSYEPRTGGRTVEDLLDAAPETLSDVDVAREYYDGRGNRLQQVRRGDDAADGSKRWIVGHRSAYNVRGETAYEYPNVLVDSLAYHPNLSTNGEVAYRYNGSDSVTRVERPDGTTVRIDHYPDRTERWEPGVSDGDSPIVEQLNAHGELVGVERPTGDGDVNGTRYDRDLRGRIVAITDATGRTSTTYTYAGPGHPIRIKHADAGQRTFWYDADDNRRLRTDALGQRLAMEYDTQGRLVEATDETDPSDPTTMRTKTYDRTQLVESTDGDVTVSFGYDAAGRQTTRTVDLDGGDTYTLEHEYGIQGDLNAITYPDGTRVSYAYGDHGSPVSASGFVDDVTYDAHERPTTIEFSGAASCSYSYDGSDQDMTAATLRDGAGSVLRSLGFEYDDGGNVTDITDEFPSETLHRHFEYDRLYRLTAAERRADGPGGSPDVRDEYAYTPTGDLTRNDESMAGPMEYSDPAHAGRLTDVTFAGDDDPTSLSYDAAGRVTSYDELETLEYDIFDRLVKAETADGRVVTFDYDAEGTRVEKTVDTGEETRTTTYVGDRYEEGPDGERLTIKLGDLTVGVKTIPGNGGDAQAAHVLTDHLGSIVAACDDTGSVVHQQVYSPFGRTMRSGSGHNRYLGLDTDADLGIAQFGDRYYAPEIGRFLTPDWFILENPQPAVRHPQGLNVYSYAVNNPVRFKDPTGKFAFLAAVAIGAGAGFAVGFVGGTVYGLTQGENLGQSMLRGVEAGLLGVAGGTLGALTGGAAFGVLGFSAATGAAIGGVVGALNGYISGAKQTYRWSDGSGFAAFLADSTWGLPGTSLGLLVHFVNWTFHGGGGYAEADSRRSNHHIYDGGFAVKSDYALTQGNVISNLQGNRGALYRHEQLHVTQSRVFGPIYQGLYAGWLLAGGVAGFVIGLGTEQDIGRDIEDVAYFDNPWETWAYQQEGPSDNVGGTLSWNNG